MSIKSVAIRAENLLSTLALSGIMLLPLAEIASRKLLGLGVPGSGPFAQNLTLWLGLFGAAIAAREGKLLTLATGEFLPKNRVGEVAHLISGAGGAMVSTLLAIGGFVLLQSDRAAGDVIAIGVPVWVADLALPIGFGLIALRLVWRASPHWPGRAVAALGIVAAFIIQDHRSAFEGGALWPWLVTVLVAAVFGAPIFALLAGIAIFATLVAGNPPVVLLVKAYEELTTSTGLAAIPLFTLAGFLLAEHACRVPAGGVDALQQAGSIAQVITLV